jgi:MSHA biogenesis protein MshE
MRDEETAEIGLRAAMTGHLVLSTLHTNDAVSTALRLLDMGVAGYMVASSLHAVLSQRLVRRVCPMCVEKDPLNVSKRNWLRAALGEKDQESEFKRGAGCAHCNNTGYRGRIGIFELLEMDDILADALRRGASADFAAAARNKANFRPLTSNALDYAREGITSLDEVIRVSGELEQALESVEPAPPEAESKEEKVAPAQEQSEEATSPETRYLEE